MQRVEPEHAQHAGEPAEVRVRHEARLAQGTLAQPQQGRHVQRLEAGIHRHPVAVLELPAEVHRLAIDQDQLDLGVRHAERLDHVLGGRRARARHREFLLAPDRREEIVQFFIEAEGGGDHLPAIVAI